MPNSIITSNSQIRLFWKDISMVSPFRVNRFSKKQPLSYLVCLFAESIMKKYNILDSYSFDAAVLVFLDNLREEAKKHEKFMAIVEQTWHLLVLWNEHAEVKNQIICSQNVYLHNLKNKIELNLSQIRGSDFQYYNQLIKFYKNESRENSPSQKKIVPQLEIFVNKLRNNIQIFQHNKINKVATNIVSRETIKPHSFLYFSTVSKNGLKINNTSMNEEFFHLFLQHLMSNNFTQNQHYFNEKSRKLTFNIFENSLSKILFSPNGGQTQLSLRLFENNILSKIFNKTDNFYKKKINIFNFFEPTALKVRFSFNDKIQPVFPVFRLSGNHLNNLFSRVKSNNNFVINNQYRVFESQHDKINNKNNFFETYLNKNTTLKEILEFNKQFNNISKIFNINKKKLIQSRAEKRRKQLFLRKIKETVYQYNLVEAEIWKIKSVNFLGNSLKLNQNINLKQILEFNKRFNSKSKVFSIGQERLIQNQAKNRQEQLFSEEIAETVYPYNPVEAESQRIKNLNFLEAYLKQNVYLKQILEFNKRFNSKSEVFSIGREGLIQNRAKNRQEQFWLEEFVPQERVEKIYQYKTLKAEDKALKAEIQRIKDFNFFESYLKQNVYLKQILEFNKQFNNKSKVFSIGRERLIQNQAKNRQEQLFSEEITKIVYPYNPVEAESQRIKSFNFLKSSLKLKQNVYLKQILEFNKQFKNKSKINKIGEEELIRNQFKNRQQQLSLAESKEIVNRYDTSQFQKVNHLDFLGIYINRNGFYKNILTRNKIHEHVFPSNIFAISAEKTPGGLTGKKFFSVWRQKLHLSTEINEFSGTLNKYINMPVQLIILKEDIPRRRVRDSKIYYSGNKKVTDTRQLKIFSQKTSLPTETLNCVTGISFLYHYDFIFKQDKTNSVIDQFLKKEKIFSKIVENKLKFGVQTIFGSNINAFGQNNISILKNIKTTIRLKDESIKRLFHKNFIGTIRKVYNINPKLTDYTRNVDMVFNNSNKVSPKKQLNSDTYIPSRSELIRQFGNLIDDPNLPSLEFINRQAGSIPVGGNSGRIADPVNIHEMVTKLTLGEKTLREEQSKLFELTQKLTEQENTIYKLKHDYTQLQEDVAAGRNVKKITSMVIKELRAKIKLEKMRYGLE